MLLNRIELFVSVAKHQNLARTAREMHVSASSVCQRLKSLENDFGVKLYTRTKAGIEITEAGQAVLSTAKDVLSRLEILRAKFLHWPETKVGTLTIGGTYNPSAKDLPAAIATFKDAYPDTRVRFLTYTRAEIEKLLQERKVDIAVIQSPSNSADLVLEPFAEDNLTFFGHPTHPLTRKKTLDLSDISDSPLIIREGGTTVRMIQQLEARGFTPNVVLRCVSPDAVKAAVRRKMGVGVLFSALIDENVSAKEFKILNLNLGTIKTVGKSFIVYSKKQPLSSAASDFLALLRSKKAQPNSTITSEVA
jgi:DNA-binding transcriptional LysR family regulator